VGTWLEWVRAIYPIVVMLVSLAGLGIFLWLATQFVTRRDSDKAKATADNRLAILEEHRASHETRLKLLEEHVDASPTRQELHDEISELAARMSSVETGLKSIGKQLDTTNNYLHTLIEKAMPGGGRR
jgi:chromosome segregation ATPase